MKNITVFYGPEGGEETRADVQLNPGSTARDVLSALELTGYTLSKKGEGNQFSADEELYPSVEESSMLRAVPLAQVGVFIRRDHHVAPLA